MRARVIQSSCAEDPGPASSLADRAGGGKEKIQSLKLSFAHVSSKCGSLTNVTYQPGGKCLSVCLPACLCAFVAGSVWIFVCLYAYACACLLSILLFVCACFCVYASEFVGLCGWLSQHAFLSRCRHRRQGSHPRGCETKFVLSLTQNQHASNCAIDITHRRDAWTIRYVYTTCMHAHTFT
jgi:hypothetical protein